VTSFLSVSISASRQREEQTVLLIELMFKNGKKNSRPVPLKLESPDVSIAKIYSNKNSLDWKNQFAQIRQCFRIFA
jgi:hypothetical protein